MDDVTATLIRVHFWQSRILKHEMVPDHSSWTLMKAHLLVGRIEMGADESTLIMWSTLFFVLENFQTEVADPDLENNLQQLGNTNNNTKSSSAL